MPDLTVFPHSQNILRAQFAPLKEKLQELLDYSLLHSVNSPLNLMQRIKKELLDLRGQPVDNLFLVELLLEFKKYLFLLQLHPEVVVPSPLLDVVLREFILFSSQYLKFCRTFLGSNNHFRSDPRNHPENSHHKYSQTILLLKMYFRDYNPMIWLNFETVEDYAHFIYSLKYMNAKTIHKIKFDYLEMEYESGNHSGTQTASTNNKDNLLQLTSENTNEFSPPDKVDHSPIYHEVLALHPDEFAINQSLFDSLADVNIYDFLPPKFLKIFVNELNCSKEHGRKLIEEYLKYMVIGAVKLTKTYGISPSDHVDQVWHMHQQNGWHYNKFCVRLFTRPWVLHDPNDGTSGKTTTLKHNYNWTKLMLRRLWGPEDLRYWPADYVNFSHHSFNNRYLYLVKHSVRYWCCVDCHKMMNRSNADTDVLCNTDQKFNKRKVKKRNSNYDAPEDLSLKFLKMYIRGDGNGIRENDNNENNQYHYVGYDGLVKFNGYIGEPKHQENQEHARSFHYSFYCYNPKLGYCNVLQLNEVDLARIQKLLSNSMYLSVDVSGDTTIQSFDLNAKEVEFSADFWGEYYNQYGGADDGWFNIFYKYKPYENESEMMEFLDKLLDCCDQDGSSSASASTLEQNLDRYDLKYFDRIVNTNNYTLNGNENVNVNENEDLIKNKNKSRKKIKYIEDL